MIKRRNLSEAVEDFVVSGTLAASATNVLDLKIAPFTGFIKGIIAKLGVAGTQGTGGTTLPTLNLQKNGSNLFANATPITFASGAVAATYDATDFAANTQVKVTKGDRLALLVTVVYNGTGPVQPIAASVQISYSRKPVSIATDNVDPDDLFA